MSVQSIELSLAPEIGFNDEALAEHLVDKYLKGSFSHYQLKKRSVDSRRGATKVKLIVDLSDQEINLPDDYWTKSKLGDVSNAPEVHIVGAGPAGYFAALQCIEQGLKPILLERGKDVKDRRIDLANMNKKHLVHPDSNYCYGEGGAGTYSDGKLYTRSKKRGSVQKVLQVLVAHGATDKILIESHPHIGTNKLPKVIQDIRESILAAGGEIHFHTRLDSVEKNSSKITKLITNQGVYMVNSVILATGHSARDIYHLLDKHQILIEAKPFALGVRIEHQQQLIDQIQYKTNDRGYYLPAAPYTLKHNEMYRGNSEGVFSFCMCPGGFIVPAATSPGEVVVNGMSPSKRNSQFSNSGIVVTVHDKDFEPYQKYGALRGMYYQAAIEAKNYEMAGQSQKACGQRMTDFVNQKVSNSLPACSYQPGLESTDLDQVLPHKIATVLRAGFKKFGGAMKGYLTDDAVLVGVESRTSSPVKIPRDKETLQHPEMKNLFPCGEGAGFAGGIVSAAIDGMNCVDAVSVYLKK